ncbi:EthD domain-containing protein [Pseudoteredinibacter isoporae]|uniref:EthD domain-containing protein n=1 Tax=Pseudoteredinibacter isoporae TaxID=570281 RepID=A0A7X0JT95_9GAMM|nr:EthD domain-containing protein [Pseudoteredinibacter isoporae]MBB6521303.1 hypothetical protein [Pseudoteredinibacter isoporae]NHO86860.1 EthD domain-containing protein [Pseudoteredinibacter isoporae]NIB24688.1 EthD domain-containing protein [Pseudoteredinibacter isoporae]
MIKELSNFNKRLALLNVLILAVFMPSLSIAGSEYATSGAPQKPATEEHAAKPMVKISYLMSRKAGMTREQFLDYWSNKHPAAGGEGSFEALGVKRYIQTHTLDIPERKAVVSVRTGLLPEFDGVAELWVEREFLEKEWPTEKVQDFIKKFYADELNFVDWSRSTILVSKELVYMP